MIRNHAKSEAQKEDELLFASPEFKLLGVTIDMLGLLTTVAVLCGFAINSAVSIIDILWRMFAIGCFCY